MPLLIPRHGLSQHVSPLGPSRTSYSSRAPDPSSSFLIIRSLQDSGAGNSEILTRLGKPWRTLRLSLLALVLSDLWRRYMPPREDTKSKSMSCGRVSEAIFFFLVCMVSPDASELGPMALLCSYCNNPSFFFFYGVGYYFCNGFSVFNDTMLLPLLYLKIWLSLSQWHGCETAPLTGLRSSRSQHRAAQLYKIHQLGFVRARASCYAAVW